MAHGHGDSKYRVAQHFIFHTLEDLDHRAGRVFGIFLMSLIALNVAAEILETIHAVEHEFYGFFKVFKAVSIGIFTVEIVLRVWACTG